MDPFFTWLRHLPISVWIAESESLLASVTLAFLWVGVIDFGRMLPYIGTAF